ncbi:MAG: hypothetical protein LH485_01375 [Sphingomonas bacterium]|nr:hypothetical protein [Sphingomonas bacterium]
MIEQGTIRAGDAVALVGRPNPGFAFERLVDIVNFQSASSAEREAMATMSGLATGLRDKARNHLRPPD